ncbi:BTAD domain-containing putative transcriptional regulator [Nonomuraea sp. NPDC059194]|uniref:AfsR/SARP family transcriptional regulator n=1 Tax=Nonomuraea sp. NPDC059194 TaxID=3346764 RepID=UPI003697A6B3
MNVDQVREVGRVSVGVLGAVGLMRDRVVLTPSAPLLRALLGLLAVSAGTPVPSAEIIRVVWQDQPPRDPKGALHLAACRLRTWLRVSGETRVRVGTGSDGYHLDLDGGLTDLEVFRREVARNDATCERLTAALALWRGRPFANVPERRADGRIIESLLAERDAVTRRAARAALDEGRPQPAIGLVERLCRADSLDEEAHAILIEGLVATGQQGAAVVTFDRIRRRLAVELGIEPGTLLRQAHLRALTGSDPPDGNQGRSGGASEAGRPAYGQRGEHGEDGQHGEDGEHGPGARARLVGRERDHAGLADLLRSRRLVTVIGPPGIGKSRLCAELAVREARHFPGGVRVARPHEPLSPPSGTGPALLVADDCDGRMGEARAAAERLAAASPELTVLVTARRPLGVSGEVIWSLGPLDAAAAERLLRARAAEAVPGLDFGPDDQPWLARLGALADGVPAVIESLASLTRAFPVRVLAEQAEQDLGALIDDVNPAAARFADGLDEVWQGLTSPQRALLLRVAAFPGDFGLHCAVAECAEPPLDAASVPGVLAALVDRGCVLPFESATGRRYRLLVPVRAMVLRRYRQPKPGTLSMARLPARAR